MCYSSIDEVRLNKPKPNYFYRPIGKTNNNQVEPNTSSPMDSNEASSSQSKDANQASTSNGKQATTSNVGLNV